MRPKSDAAAATTKHVPASLRALLANVVDYAGLFPPAQLSMTEAVRNYARYVASDDAWMLGRFIVPVARLAEFEAATHDIGFGQPSRSLWRLSALVSEDVANDIEKIESFNARHEAQANDENRRFVIDAIEMKAGGAAEIEQASELIPRNISAYFEIPLNDDLTELLHAVEECGARAKIRTGGVASDAFPSSDEVARFIFECARNQVAFKATAGLHHPLRAEYKLTYEPDSPRGVMHGFLNLFLAAAFARQGAQVERLTGLLNETDRAAFSFDDDGASWRDLKIETAALERARRDFVISFGSCSFDEPVSELSETLRD